MRPLKSAILFLMVSAIVNVPGTAFAQRLPKGEHHQNRERSVDIIHYKARISVDLPEKKVSGEVTVTFSPLVETGNLQLDAIHLNIDGVERIDTDPPRNLRFKSTDRSLVIALGQNETPQDTLRVKINYSCSPKAGMYFEQDMHHKGQYFVYTYGEGGLHANWLPIYNDVNDKFSTEMIITVPKPYSALSNGKLIEVEKEPGNARTFHWIQKLPHSNYLIAVSVGQYEKGELRPAFGSIPIDYWVPEGRLREGAFAFRNTTRMVEFFSKRFNYVYPWDKYDQVTVRNFSESAMEHTGITLFNDSVLRTESAPLTFGGPDFHAYHDIWTAEATIAHELSHHWFGDNLTCRNLSYIWLNESFATYCQMLWNEESLGKELFQLDRRIALDHYLKYVAEKHLIRPLEYHDFDKPDDMYTDEITYLKGALVLHMLRSFLGDEAFFHALSYYLEKHEFGNVESNDFKIAIEEATGRNFNWFFDDWVYGAGRPVFEVDYTYLKDRKLVDLKVKQIQPIIEGQGLFKLPVEIAIANKKGKDKYTLRIDEAEEEFMLASETEPLMVSFDGAGNLVAEVIFEKGIEELSYQIGHDELPGRIRALRQLARRFPTHLKTLRRISRILAGDDFWGLKAEAALLLGILRTPAAEREVAHALKAKDYRIRKAAVLALPQFGTSSAIEALKRVIGSDPQMDVVATAILSLAKVDPENSVDFIRRQIGRPSWYDEIKIACLEAFGLIGKPSLVHDIRPYTAVAYNNDVRKTALKAWAKGAPEDPALHEMLIALAENTPGDLQETAVEMLGNLHVRPAKSILEEIVSTSGNTDLRVTAKRALERIERLDNVTR